MNAGAGEKHAMSIEKVDAGEAREKERRMPSVCNGGATNTIAGTKNEHRAFTEGTRAQ